MAGESPTPRSNRLAGETSPYLLQHADNPVDWYPWGEEAFARARELDRPIFLSIGYATCHWCHVMERECFADPEVAALMNATFVNVKVDREERPDIDQVYMTVCQMLTGSGGWPLTIVMTPEGEPFFAATYIPKHARFGRPGMMELVPRIAELWRTHRDRLLADAREVTAALRRAAGAAGPPAEPGPAELDAAFRQLAARFDPEWGGFGTAPKFPTPHTLLFLLGHWYRTGERRALEMVVRTLEAMDRGGIHDHLGGGFHRYATDRRWLVPHFEKMLYDQALLAVAHLEAYRATGREDLAATARETLAYVDRDLSVQGGGFASAEDADSEGEEGRFYLWTMEEVRAVLRGPELEAAVAAWNLEPDGNYGDEVTGMATGRNILHRIGTPDPEVAHRLGIAPGELRRRLERARRALLAARSRRPRPLRVDTVLADWNGLAIGAFARAGVVLDAPSLAARAERAARFVLAHLEDRDGALLHRYRAGEAAVPAMLDDHAFLAWGLIELHQATLDPVWLEAALEIATRALERFVAPDGGLYMTESSPDLPVRPRDAGDGALPAGSSVLVDDLLRLARLTGRGDLAEAARRIAAAAGPSVRRAPSAHTALLAAIASTAAPTYEVVVAGDPGDRRTRALVAAARAGYHPGSVVLLVPPGPEGDPVRRLAPFTAGQGPADGRPVAYVCRDGACLLPTADPAAVRAALAGRPEARAK